MAQAKIVSHREKFTIFYHLTLTIIIYLVYLNQGSGSILQSDKKFLLFIQSFVANLADCKNCVRKIFNRIKVKLTV